MPRNAIRNKYFYEVNIFWKPLDFLHNPLNVANLISGSSASSKPSLYIWNFLVLILLKLSMKDLGHNFTSMWNECNCMVVWTYFCTKTDLFQFCGCCCLFQIYWHIAYSTLTGSSFGIWNSSAGIPPPPLALFVVMLPKAHLTSHCRMSSSRWVTTLSCLSGSLRPFFFFLLLFFFHLFLLVGG